MKHGNLFSQIPGVLTEELAETLATGSGPLRIERIVSRGDHASPEGHWYDQSEVEWVVLLRGSGILRFEEDGQLLKMGVGDWVEIPAHCRHRVESTAAGEETLWLAVFSG